MTTNSPTYEMLVRKIREVLKRDASKDQKATYDQRQQIAKIFFLKGFGITNYGQAYAYDAVWAEFFNRVRLDPSEKFEDFKRNHLTVVNFATGKNGRRGRYLILPCKEQNDNDNSTTNGYSDSDNNTPQNSKEETTNNESAHESDSSSHPNPPSATAPDYDNTLQGTPIDTGAAPTADLGQSGMLGQPMPLPIEHQAWPTACPDDRYGGQPMYYTPQLPAQHQYPRTYGVPDGSLVSNPWVTDGLAVTPLQPETDLYGVDPSAQCCEGRNKRLLERTTEDYILPAKRRKMYMQSIPVPPGNTSYQSTISGGANFVWPYTTDQWASSAEYSMAYATNNNSLRMYNTQGYEDYNEVEGSYYALPPQSYSYSNFDNQSTSCLSVLDYPDATPEMVSLVL